MPRSSESIAALAAALAKAQAELINPEKSLVGTIRQQGRDTAERSFRYASLSSGLDIVRKTLGQHQIATLQTTAIDQAAGTVNLTTTLAHASGEWIASDWPVCAVADTATPHRMGAALTYARRYALFTLVGIAGEDDLDAPDLIAPAGQATGPGGSRDGIGAGRSGNGHAHRPREERRRSRHQVRPATMLPADRSSAERDRLLAELQALESSDAAAAWAHKILPVKNTLAATDAQNVEDAFQAKLMRLADPEATGPEATTAAPTLPRTLSQAVLSSTSPRPSPVGLAIAVVGIDKSELALPEPRRIRDKDHLKFVAKQPCLVCNRRPADPHHLRFAQARAMGRKVSDEFTVPLCRGHHRDNHRWGDEAAWWAKRHIDAFAAARALWLTTHPLTASAPISAEGTDRDSGLTTGAGEPARPRRSRNRIAGSQAAPRKPTRNNKTKPIPLVGSP